jgi:hypothetical protein
VILSHADKSDQKGKKPMDSDIDKPMRPIVKKINKSRYVKTAFCCAGHKFKEDLELTTLTNVYIVFEMHQKHVGSFLKLALTCLTKKMVRDCSLNPRIGRTIHGKWPRKNRERVALCFYSDDPAAQLSKKQVKIARKYFMRLAEKTAAAL